MYLESCKVSNYIYFQTQKSGKKM